MKSELHAVVRSTVSIGYCFSTLWNHSKIREVLLLYRIFEKVKIFLYFSDIFHTVFGYYCENSNYSVCIEKEKYQYCYVRVVPICTL